MDHPRLVRRPFAEQRVRFQGDRFGRRRSPCEAHASSQSRPAMQVGRVGLAAARVAWRFREITARALEETRAIEESVFAIARLGYQRTRDFGALDRWTTPPERRYDAPERWTRPGRVWWPRASPRRFSHRPRRKTPMRVKFLAITTTLALSMAAASTAAAAPSNDVDADSAARVEGGGGGADTTVYDFDDDNVDGEILSPDGANVNSRARVKHASLITIRPHFISELISLSFDI